MVDYYQEFNIDPSIKGDKLSEVLRNLQRKWIGRTNAPDLNRRQEAERKVALIEEAQKVLLDETKRAAYDKELNSTDPIQNETQTMVLDQTNNDAASLIQQAWNFINTRKYSDAIMVARMATELEGNNADAWATLGYADYLWNNPQDAIYEYKKAINLKPNNDTFYSDLGNIYLDNNMLNEAEDCANKAMYINSQNNYNKLLLGNVVAAKNEYDKAITIFSELLEVEPNNDSFKQVLANSYYFKGLNFCYRADDGYFYNVEEQATKNMIECMKKARSYVNDPEYSSKIAWGEKALKKQFDKSKWTLFIIPILFLFSQNTLGIILGILLIAGLGYLCMRPGWRMTRNSLFNEKTLFDHLTGFIIIVLGAIAGFIFGFIRAIFSSFGDRR